MDRKIIASRMWTEIENMGWFSFLFPSPVSILLLSDIEFTKDSAQIMFLILGNNFWSFLGVSDLMTQNNRKMGKLTNMHTHGAQ